MKTLIRNLLSNFPAAAAVTVAIGTVLLAKLIRNRKTTAAATAEAPFLATSNGETYIPLTLRETIRVSHDVRIFRFALAAPAQALGLPAGMHMSFKATIDGKDIVRSYTPITSDARDKGYVDVMVKVYFANTNPKFPEGGKMSQHLEKMRPGETILVKGPTGRHEYTGNGRFRVKAAGKNGYTDKPPMKHIGMIAGGSGITPMLRVMRSILHDATDATTVHLLFANHSEDDVLLQAELEACARDDPARFNVWFTVSAAAGDATHQAVAAAPWKYSRGRIDDAMIGQHMPKPGPDTLIVLCGPNAFVNAGCKPSLERLGFREEQILVF